MLNKIFRKVPLLTAIILCLAVGLTACRIHVAEEDSGTSSTVDSKVAKNGDNGDSSDGEGEGEDGGEESEPAVPDAVGFSDNYSNIPGVFNFRGGNTRAYPAYGSVSIKKRKLKQVWKNTLPGTGSIWGGGAGWTGQPAVIQWPEETRKCMNIKKKFKNDESFVEVIQASLNGKVYFFDLKTGEATRDPIDLGNPVKGSVSVDPRGYPIVLVGQGIDENGKPGFYLVNLINNSVLYYQSSYDSYAPRHWAGNDSSALFDKDSDTVYMCSENALVYKLKLNTKFDPKAKTLSVSPKVKRYNTVSAPKFRTSASLSGVENSPAAYDNLLFFADNSGLIRCITTNFKEKWSYKNLDDVDASIILEVEDGVPMLYCGCEVDKQGYSGKCRIVKLNGLTGKVVWKKEYKCYNRDGASPSNGGLLGTPVLGKGQIGDRIIFTLCRYPDFDSGTLIALNKKNGKTIYEKKLETYCWPSPVDIYDSETGAAYIIQNDHDGTMRMFDANNGKEVFSKKVDTYLEASPVVFNDRVVFSTRSGYMFAFDIK